MIEDQEIEDTLKPGMVNLVHYIGDSEVQRKAEVLSGMADCICTGISKKNNAAVIAEEAPNLNKVVELILNNKAELGGRRMDSITHIFVH